MSGNVVRRQREKQLFVRGNGSRWGVTRKEKTGGKCSPEGTMARGEQSGHCWGLTEREQEH